MNKTEYIEFTFNDKAKFENCNEFLNEIFKCNNNEKKKSEEFWLKIIPEYVIEYFKDSEKNKSWNLKNIIQFINENLDVNFIGLYSNQVGIGKLDFEARGYPYGGPSSLITLLRAFDCVAFETNDGADIYKIRWNSNFEFAFDSTVLKENRIEEKGIKAFIKRLMK
ncbi:hypothetical protein [Flavobacterium tegetincola]|uniref:hypothetical protein n=1 Tax=Flavobacterium tegetincola TaxID=150172 RepID=UPI0003F50FAA|nr:hypothetical protein [Flavobacterium tegetincola]